MKSEILREKEYAEERFLTKYAPTGLSTLSREVISKGSREGMKRARAEYRWQSRPPDGFILDRNKKLLPNERAPLINSVFAKYDEIENTAQIAFDLNKQGIKTRDEGKWTTLKIYRLLKNPIYKGIYKSKETEAYVPEYQIVNTKLFDRVQKKLKKRGTKKEMPAERKKAKVDEVFDSYLERLKTLEIPTERVMKLKPEIDKESLFYPRGNEPTLTRIEKIRLRVLIHLEEICKIIGEEKELLDKKASDSIIEITKNLDKVVNGVVSGHPEKRKIMEGDIEEEKRRLKQLVIENQKFLNEVVN